MSGSEGDCTPEERASLSKLAQGVRAAYENAEQLYDEALALTRRRATCRAMFLHQISMEELAKVDLLGGWATGMLMGIPVDWDEIVRSMASHKVKNQMNAYLQPPGEVEAAAKKQGDWKEAHEAFSKMKAAFHAQSNSAKNAALYVDFVEGSFVTPSERITSEMLADLRETNRRHLGLLQPNVRMITGWEADSNRAKRLVLQFHRRMDAVKETPIADQMKAMEEVLAEMLKEEVERRRS